jgi:hypothetical protein
MSRAKSHLYVSTFPIRSGETLEAECGAPIANALATYCGEDAATVAVTCSRCQKATVAKSEQVRLFYALVNGQEAKLEGNDAD